MTTLKPTGVNHLALSTTDMKRQLTFWCDVLGLPLKALYWMHGVEGTFILLENGASLLRVPDSRVEWLLSKAPIVYGDDVLAEHSAQKPR